MLPTQFAPAERADQVTLARDFHRFLQLDDVQAFVNALPHIVAVLNAERQIVYANTSLLQNAGLDSLDGVIGARLGEFIQCRHAWDEPGGCGTSADCRYCGAVQAILQSQQQQAKVEKECRILSEIKGESVAWDFWVSASPFHCGQTDYTILSLVDISDEKRRQALERIFFHDIINTAGSLSGLLDILKEEGDQALLRAYLELAGDISHNLIDEILAQRQLLAAERGELELERRAVLSKELMREAMKSIMQHEVAKGRTLLMAPDSVEVVLTTDPVLLGRVLVNMVKNALEATPKGGMVRIGCEMVEAARLVFWVHNPGYISAKTRSMIFQRSFSTKGKNRGLGTYSMKLLGEKYLRGRVSFQSEPDTGTIFRIELPSAPGL